MSTVIFQRGAGGGGGGGVAILGGTQLATSGTVVFSNANNFSFGLSGSSRMTLTYDGDHHTGSHVFRVGRTNYAGPEFIQVDISNTLFYLMFSQGTHATPQVRFAAPAATDGVASVVYWEGLAAMGVSSGGNTLGNTGLSQRTAASVVFQGGNNITLSQVTGDGATTVEVSLNKHHHLNETVIYMGQTLSGVIVPALVINHFDSTMGLYFQPGRLSAYVTIPGGSTNDATVALQEHLPQMGVSTFGNTAGSTGLVSGKNQSLLLVGSNNITLSQSSNASGVTVSFLGGAGGGGGVAISALGGVISSGTAVFTALTGDTHTSLQNVQFSRDGQSIRGWVYPQYFTKDDVVMIGRTEANNVPFIDFVQSVSYFDIGAKMAGGNAAQSVVFEAISDANERTVAIWDHLPGFGVSNLGNTAGSTGAATGARKTLVLVGSNNITLSQSLNTAGATVSIIGGAGGGGVAISAAGSSQSAGTVVFSNSNGLAFGMNGSTVTGSYSQSTAPGGIAASNTTYTSGTVVFSGSNNVTVSYNGSTVLVSGPATHAVQSGISSIVANAASTVSAGAVVFSNSNNVSFGLNGSTMTASASYSQSTGPAAIAANAASSVTGGTVVFSNSNNVSFGFNGSTMTASASYSQSTGPSGIAGSAASTVTSGVVVFSNLNNVSFGLNGSTMTASIPAGATATGNLGAIVASNSTYTSGTVLFTGVNNITVSYNGTTISISGAATHAQQTGVSGIVVGAGTFSSGSIVFSNSNNVSFGLNASTMTASASYSQSTAPSALVASNTTITAGSVVFSASANMTISYNGQSILFSGGAGGAAGTNTFSVAGGSSITGSNIQVVFSNISNVTLGQTTAGSSMTIGFSGNAPDGGAGYTKNIKFLHEDLIGFNTGTVATSEGTQYIWMPLHIDNPISISQVMMLNSMTWTTGSSSNSSGRQSFSYALSLYVFRRSDFGANSASLTYHTSASGGLSASRSHTSNQNSISIAWVTNSTGGTSSFSTTGTGSAWQTGLSGPRFFMVPLVTSLSQGEWFIARRHSSTTGTAGSNATLLSISAIAFTMQTGLGMVMPIGSSNSNLSNPFHGIGFGSASAITTNAVMDGTVISAGSSALRVPFGVIVNMPWKA